MLIARFYFKPGEADDFAWTEGQEVVEQMFASTWELIEVCDMIQDRILDCIVNDGDQIISLKAVSEETHRRNRETSTRRNRSKKKANKE